MGLAEIAIMVSIVSALISGMSLGWSMFKEIGLRARVRVNLAVVILIPGLPNKSNSFVSVRCVNMGPGAVKLDGLHFTFRKLQGGGKIDVGHAITMCDYGHPYCSQLPKLLEIGETATYLIPFTKECFLHLDVLRFSVSDSFGKSHWVKYSEITRARSEFVKRFVLNPLPDDNA